jgi:16S rRNA (cytosine1402-N4)-methyltransferase
LESLHQPVLLSEAVELLAPRRGGLFIDCTVGLGGHAEALLAASPEVQLVGIDRDPEALALAGRRLAPFGPRVRLVEGGFERLAELLAGLEPPFGGRTAAGILADLGVSSLQLDRGERGFSFRREGPLDMRMGRGGTTAAEVVNTYPEAPLEKIIRDFGEEPQARLIARAIVSERDEKPFVTTTDLAEVVARAKGGPRRRARSRTEGARSRKRGGPRDGRIDPSTRVFQALRIEVNQELAALPELLDQAVRLLDQDGRLVVISYHSLEDRVVKNTLRDLARGEVDEITGRPLWETQVIEVLTRRPARPTPQEVAANPRSRSARLRAARRL